MKDSNGNLINVTLFESYFSKYLIEHPEFFEPVYQKILSGIEAIIILNKDNESFNRMLYTTFSLIKQEYNCTCIEHLKKNFNLFSVNYFMKLFCDFILNNKEITLILPSSKSIGKVPSLFLLCKQTLFQKSKDGNTKASSYFRIPVLFNINDRGVTDREDDEIVTTKKIGITTIEQAPEDLNSYFKLSHEPSQFLYTPDRKSNVGKWFSRHNLPIISGSSGSATDNLALMLGLLNPTNRDVQLLMISLAATLIAKGHHSYFEIMFLLEDYGLGLKSAESLFDFYEQTLPKSITLNDSYIKFKNSSSGSKLLDGISDDLSIGGSVQMLPSLSIGLKKEAPEMKEQKTNSK